MFKNYVHHRTQWSLLFILALGIFCLFSYPSAAFFPAEDTEQENSASPMQEVMMGDVNCDDVVNSVDGLFILQYDVGLRDASEGCSALQRSPSQERTLNHLVCDVDENDDCGSVDALFILQCDIGRMNGFCPEPTPVPTATATYSISGVVWKDDDGNGQRDADEPLVENISVALLNKSSNEIYTDSTDENGEYSFSELGPNAYYAVKFYFKGFTIQDVGNDETDSDVDPTGESVPVTVPVNNTVRIDAGVRNIPGRIIGRVFNDINGNGIQDIGEPSEPGIEVELLAQSGTVLASDTTGDDGTYAFSELDPKQNYRINFIAPAGKGFTEQDVGIDALDSDANPGTGQTELIDVPGDETVENIDAGLITTFDLALRKTISHTHSLVLDGYRATFQIEICNQGGISAWDILIVDYYTPIVFTLDDAAWTKVADNQAELTIAGPLAPSACIIEEIRFIFSKTSTGSFQPVNNKAEIVQAYDDVGDLRTSDVDSIYDRIEDNDLVLDDESNLTPDDGDEDDHDLAAITILPRGFIPPTGEVLINGIVWKDNNLDGIQDIDEPMLNGIIVNLLAEDGTLIDSTETTAEYGYGFSDLDFDTSYVVEVELPDGMDFTAFGGDSDIDPDTGKSVIISVPAGRIAHVDAGINSKSSDITGLVFHDTNRNDIRDAGEKGVANVQVQLYDNAMNLSATSVTDAAGEYTFLDLSPSTTYKLKLILPLGLEFAKQDVGSNDRVDSDVNPNPSESNPVVAHASNPVKVDAGIRPKPNSIIGTVFRDTERNDIQDDGDRVVPKFEVQLHDSAMNLFVKTKTNHEGRYIFPDLTPNATYILKFVLLPDFKFVVQDVGDDDLVDSDVDPERGNSDPVVVPPDGAVTIDAGVVLVLEPVILNVNTEYKLENTRFLQGISVKNKIRVTVEWWDNPPGKVEFKLNSQPIADKNTTDNIATYTLNMGSALQSGHNKLEIVAQAGGNNGQKSEPKIFQFYSIPLPVWISGIVDLGLGSLPLMASGNVRGGASYGMGFHFPNQPFTVDVARLGPLDQGAKFDWGVGGMLTIPLDCSTVPTTKLSTSGGLEFLDSTINLTLEAGIKFQKIEFCSFQPSNGFAGVTANYEGTFYKKPVLIMISYLNPAFGGAVDRATSVFGANKLIGVLGEFYIKGQIGAEAKFQNIQFGDSLSKPLVLKDLELSARLGIDTGISVSFSKIKIDASVGGSGEISFLRAGEISLPITENWKFDKITFKGNAGVKLKVFWMERELKGEVTWTYPPTARSAALIEPLEISDWRLIEHSSMNRTSGILLETEVGQTFARQSLRRSAMNALVSSATLTEVLISNIYPYPEISMAIHPSNNHAILTWVDTDVNKPVGQAHEIYFSQWNDVAWSQPVAIANDTLLDDAPQIAWTDDQAVAIWHRIKTELTPDAFFTITNAKQIEIATSVYSPTTSTWTEVSLLTDNNELDAYPSLVDNGSGNLLAVWQRNSAGMLSGDVANPDKIMAAFYQQGWHTEIEAVTDIPGLIDLAVGYDHDTATIAYTYHLTPTGHVTPTTQIFVSNWNGIEWSSPAQITNDAKNHQDLQIVYNATHEPLLMWLAEGTLYLRNLTTGSEDIFILPNKIEGIDEFHGLRDADNNLVVVFVSQNLPRNIYVSYYDPAHGVWSEPKMITDDSSSEKYIAPAFDNLGKLHIAYGNTAIDLVEKNLVSNGETITYTIPAEGETDLAILAHSFIKNLSLSDEDFVISDLNPQVGSTIMLSATIHNTGDRSIDNITVDFYADDPELGVEPFSSIVISDVLPGNSERLVTTTMAITQFTSEMYAIVDPADTIAESDEFDNQINRALNGPDLEIVETQVHYPGGFSVDLTTVIRNQGLNDMPATLLYYVDSSNEREIFSTTIPYLGVGEAITLTDYLDTSTLQLGRYSMVAEARVGDIIEFDQVNNSSPFQLQILPDLQILPQTIEHTPLDASMVHITSTIVNIGASPSESVTARFYRNDIFDNVNQVYTQTIDMLAPGESKVITAQIPESLCNLYIVIDQQGTLDELSKVNNIASIRTSNFLCTDYRFEVISGAPSSPPYTVQFIDMSIGENKTWLWDFGDGTTSTEQSPTHIYIDQAPYNVTLTISNEDGEHSLIRNSLIEILTSGVTDD